MSSAKASFIGVLTCSADALYKQFNFNSHLRIIIKLNCTVNYWAGTTRAPTCSPGCGGGRWRRCIRVCTAALPKRLAYRLALRDIHRCLAIGVDCAGCSTSLEQNRDRDSAPAQRDQSHCARVRKNVSIGAANEYLSYVSVYKTKKNRTCTPSAYITAAHNVLGYRKCMYLHLAWMAMSVNVLVVRICQ